MRADIHKQTGEACTPPTAYEYPPIGRTPVMSSRRLRIGTANDGERP
ncbi:MAG: hypothetical protein IKI88_05440 [Anaerotignum sp.]|nr:hypothetical protein [Anaerotignum sp.]